MRRKKLVKIAAAVISFVVLLAAPAEIVLAAKSDSLSASDVKDNIVDKAYARQLQYCYTDNQVFNYNVTIKDGGLTGDLLRSMLNNTQETVAVNNATASKGAATRYLPSSMTANDNTSCITLIRGALSRTDHSVPASNASLEDKKAFLELFGYTCPNATTTVNGREVSSKSLDCTLSGGNTNSNALTAVKNIFGYSSENALQYTDQQKLLMYQTYLQGIYKAEVSCDSDGIKELKEKKNNAQYSSQYNLYTGLRLIQSDGSVGKNCAALIRADYAQKLVNGTASNGESNYFMKSQPSNIDGVTAVLGESNVSSVSAAYVDALAAMTGSAAGYNSNTGLNTNEGAYDGSGTNTAAGSSSDDSTDAASGEDDPCFALSGALGWIICPVVNALASILEKAYEGIIEPALSISPGILQSMAERDKGIYPAWGLFRDVANIVFVILFLVVIFSQVTGFGIDNYGIKRMLPRLIIAAVLVNFSFVICQLAVDVSNILGVSLRDFLIGIGKDVALASGDGGTNIGEMFHKILGGLGIIGAVAGATALNVFKYGSLTNWGFVSMVFLNLLTAVIAVIFGFILLAARQALVVMLVVTSPLAFVLYLMPNTYRYFQQWLKIFSNMLLVFPACGLLLGAGYLAARIVLSIDDGLIFNLIGLILLVLPYFLIIPLVRMSMNAISGLGGKIQAIGRATEAGTAGRIRNSDNYKTAQNIAQTRAAGARAARSFQRQRKSQAFREAHPRWGRVVNVIGNGKYSPLRGYNEAHQDQMLRYADAAQAEEETRTKQFAASYARMNPNATMDDLWRDFKGVQGDATDPEAQRQRRALLLQMQNQGLSKDIAKRAQDEMLSGEFENTGEMLALADHLGKDNLANKTLSRENPEAFKYVMGRKNDGLYERDATGQFARNSLGQLQVKGAYRETNPRVEDIPEISNVRQAIATGLLTDERLASTLGPDAPDSVKSRWKGDQRTIAEAFQGANAADRQAMVEHYTTQIINGQPTTASPVENGRHVETLMASGGRNIMGASGAITGFMPTQADIDQHFGGTFNVDDAFTTTDGRKIIRDQSRNMAWDATNARNVSGETFNIKTNYTI